MRRKCEEEGTNEKKRINKEVGKYSAMRDEKKGGKDDGRGREWRVERKECVKREGREIGRE